MSVRYKDQVFNTSGKQNVCLVILMEHRLILIGTATHYLFSCLFKDSIRLMLLQKIDVKEEKVKPANWKWQILPLLSECYEEYNYLDLNHFQLIDFFPNLVIKNSNIKLIEAVYRIPGITIYRAYDKRSMNFCSIIYPDMDTIYSKKSLLQKTMLDVFQLSQHPNFIQIYYIDDTTDEKLFFVGEDLFSEDQNAHKTECIVSLRDWLDGYLYEDAEPDVSEKIINIALQLCSAVGYLHTNFSIHGHLSPDHILIIQKGDIFNLKLLNCCVPRVQTLGRENNFRVGNPMYWSPNQAESYYKLIETYEDIMKPNFETGKLCKDLAKDTDLYAIGLILLEMCYGERFWGIGSQSNLFEEFVSRYERMRHNKELDDDGELKITRKSYYYMVDVIKKLLTTDRYAQYDCNSCITDQIYCKARIFEANKNNKGAIGNLDLWMDFFDFTNPENIVKITNNLANGYYFMEMKLNAKIHFDKALYLNGQIEAPDELCIYNYSSFGRLVYNMDETYAIKCLNKITETPLRNQFQLILDVKRNKNFKFLYHNPRVYRKEHQLKNPVFHKKLELVHEYLQENKSSLKSKEKQFNIVQILKYGEIKKTQVCDNFQCFQTNYRSAFFLFLVPLINDENGAFIGVGEAFSYKILNRITTVVGNIVVERNTENEYIVAFSFEVVIVVLIYDLERNILHQHAIKYFPGNVQCLDVNQEIGIIVVSCDDYSIYKISIVDDPEQDGEPRKVLENNLQQVDTIYAFSEYILAHGIQGQLMMFYYDGIRVQRNDPADIKRKENVRFIGAIRNLNQYVYLTTGLEVLVEDLNTLEQIQKFYVTKGIVRFLSASSKPLLFCLRDNGLIDMYFTQRGIQIKSFGPFSNVLDFKYEEANQLLYVLDVRFRIRVYDCTVNIDQNNESEIINNISNCLIYHDYYIHKAKSYNDSQESEELSNGKTPKKDIRKLGLEICSLLKRYLNEKNDKRDLYTIFAKSEILKDSLPFFQWPNMIKIMKKVNMVYYESKNLSKYLSLGDHFRFYY